MQAVFFTCGGAESNESAFKTARFYWKAKGKPDKVKIIARHQSYHGVTLQAMSATGMPAYWRCSSPACPGSSTSRRAITYRFQGAKPGESVGQAAARELEEAILREGRDTVAAVHRRADPRRRRRHLSDRRLLAGCARGLHRHKVL
jgi:adenosylmethionine-8-amino-7-oxononanoate aminotransferase